MNNSKLIQTSVEILGKLYSIRCPEEELQSLQQAAALLSQKMAEVQESGKAINLERIAIITALNIAHQFLQVDQHNNSFVDKINQRIADLHGKLESALNAAPSAELIETTEQC